MASYIRSWFAAPPMVETDNEISILVEEPTVDSDDDDTATIRGDDDDAPPAFPSLNSAQRTAPQADPVPRILTDTQLMPPPPPPLLASHRPGVPSAASSLAPPPSTLKPPSKVAKRGKVALAPGHGPLDWASLKKSGQNLRGVDALARIPPSVLKQHNKREDAWSAFNGKVYNITPYLPYHPGGEKELMRVAGRDGTKLFGVTHAWVNLDYMLDECLVGFLVSEPSS